ncbi:MAG: nucleoside recognition protein [Desulfobacterales bacterium]|nr:MAG: nucleoside recognition protein [Desulfobacterales bacterium]
MAYPKARINTRPLLISLLLSAAVLLAGMALMDGLTSSKLFSKLLWPLVRLMALIGIGLIAGQVIEASGWTKALSILARPLFTFGRLGPHCSVAFASAFVSGVAANAMLLEFYEERRISREQLFLANLVNQLPAFFLHLPTTFFIVIPLTGRAGALYFLLTFLAAALRTAAFLIYGHLRLRPQGPLAEDRRQDPVQPTRRNAKEILRRVLERLPVRLMRIGIYVVPIYIVVFIVNALGVFQLLRDWLARFVITTFIPMESLSVVALSLAAEFTSGFAAAGALMQAGVLTVKQTVIALLVGNILAFPLRALRHQLPHYIGIYSPKLGTQILLVGQGFRLLSLIMVGLIYLTVG